MPCGLTTMPCAHYILIFLAADSGWIHFSGTQKFDYHTLQYLKLFATVCLSIPGFPAWEKLNVYTLSLGLVIYCPQFHTMMHL